MRWFFAFIVWLSVIPILRASPNIDDISSLEWILADHPKSLEDFARKSFRQTDPEQNPKRWIHAVWLYGFLTTSWINTPWQEPEDLQKTLTKASQLAEKMGYYEEFIRLQFIAGDMYSDDKAGLNRAFYEKTLALTDQYQLTGHVRIMVLGYYSYALRDAGHADEALDLMQKAYRLLQDDPQASPLDQIFVQTNLALILRLQNKNDKAQELWLENEKIFARHQLRSLHTTNLYNLGFYELKSRDPVLKARAEAHFRQALKLAQETGEEYSQASSSLGLSSLFTEQGRHEEALQLAKKAAEIFQVLNVPIWQGEAYKRAATPLLQMKRYAEALQAIDQAAAIFPADYDQDQMQIAETKAAAFKGLGHWAEAYDQLEKARLLERKLSEAKEDKNMADKMIKLGLQVEEEKNKVLQKDNELQSQRLIVADRQRWLLIGGLLLALVVIGLMIFAIWEARKVKETRLRMQHILDTIDEGILTIDPHLRIEKGHSRYLQTLLGSDAILQGQDLLVSLLEPSSLTGDEKQLTRQVLFACFGESPEAWEFNAHQLPQELDWSREDKAFTLALHWQPIYSSHLQLQQVLLGIRDVTDRKRMQAAMQVERQRSEGFAHKLGELVNADLVRVRDLLDRLALCLALDIAAMTPFQRKTQLGSFHTAKGIARALHLRSLSSAIHSCEEVLVHGLDQKAAWQNLTAEWGDYQHLVAHILKMGSSSGTSLAISLGARVMPLIPELTERLAAAGVEWQGLLIDDQFIPWPKDWLDTVADILVHGITNSIDHGFILPKLRGMAVPSVRLQLSAAVHQGQLSVVLEDNGLGIDMQRLQELAQGRGVLANTEDELLALLFADGISTAEQTTESSGRGVGLAALKSLCEGRGGTVRLANRKLGQGSCLEITFPLTQGLKASA